MLEGRYCKARVAVITFLDAEWEAVQRLLGGEEDRWGLGYQVDDRGSPRVITVQADRTQMGGQGDVNDVLENTHPEAVIVSGIAGGIPGREEVRPGDIVVPDYVHYFRYGKLTAGGYQRRYLPADQPSSNLRKRHARPVNRPTSSERWKGRIDVERPVFPEPGGRPPRTAPIAYTEGSLVATDELMGNPEHADQIRLVGEFPDAIAVDMESMGVARAVHSYRRDVRYNPQLLIVRGISDLVLSAKQHDPELIKNAGENNKQRQEWIKYAAVAAAAYTASIVQRILERPDPRDLTG